MASEEFPTPSVKAPESSLSVRSTGPAVPEALTAAEVQDLKAKAAEAVQQLQSTRGSRELAVLDSISAVGIQAQRQAASEMGLLRERVRDMVTGEGPSGHISQDLTDLRFTLNQIDPNQVRKESLIRRIIGLAPFGQDSLLRALERIAVRYEPVSKQVVVIEARLRQGRAMLVKDNIEMRKLYEQVETQQTVIQRNAYLGELVIGELSGALEAEEDEEKRGRMRDALYDVSVRTQDMRSMEEVHAQLFVSLSMTRQNNVRLGQAVDRTLTLATNVVMVGLAIQSALARQVRVKEAVERTREFIGNLLVANAAAISQHTREIGDIYNSPVVAMEKVTQAHQDLLKAIGLADQIKSEGIVIAQQNIAKLAQLSTELMERSSGLREEKEGPTLEA